MNNGGKNSSYQELFSLNEKEEESGKSITGGQTLSHTLAAFALWKIIFKF